MKGPGKKGHIVRPPSFAEEIVIARDEHGNPLKHYWERGSLKVLMPPGEDGLAKPMCVAVALNAMMLGMMGLGTRAGHGCVEYFRTCSACGKEAAPDSGGLQSCGGCYLTSYCSKACQKAHWQDYHNVVCGEDDRSAAGINVRVLDWRYAVMKRLQSGERSSLEELRGESVLFVWRGQSIDQACWGLVDEDAQALAPNVEVIIHAGQGETIRLRGPKTAEQVLDAILRAARREISPGRNDRKPNFFDKCDDEESCAACPRRAFCGLKFLGLHNGSTPVYVALWSKPFCRIGVAQNMGLLKAKDLVPEAADNRDYDRMLDDAREAVLARRGPLRAKDTTTADHDHRPQAAARQHTSRLLHHKEPSPPAARSATEDDWIPAQRPLPSRAKPRQQGKAKHKNKHKGRRPGSKGDKRHEVTRGETSEMHDNPSTIEDKAEADEVDKRQDAPEDEKDLRFAADTQPHTTEGDAGQQLQANEEAKEEEEEAMCPVCLEDLDWSGSALPVRLQRLRCSHTFHSDCIAAWDEQCARKGWERTCPLCRDQKA